MDLKTAVFGNHELSVWFASLLWALIGAVIIKVKYLPKNLKLSEFSLKKWFGENAIDFIKSILYAMVIVRLGDLAIQLFEIYFEKLPVQIEDFVIFNLFVSLFIQYKLHNKQ